MSRYVVAKHRAWSRVLQWRIRARMIDAESGDSVEFQSAALAQEGATLLDGAGRGEAPPLPADPTPFPSYDISHGVDGWIYIWFGDGALSHRAVARSRSEELARPTADVLSRARARPRRSWRGPFKSPYF
jgi:hypothetical protein